MPAAQLTGPTVLPLELRKQTAILQFLSSRLGQASVGLTSLRITDVDLCTAVNASTAGMGRGPEDALVACRDPPHCRLSYARKISALRRSTCRSSPACAA
jgi:hypothetical protein